MSVDARSTRVAMSVALIAAVLAIYLPDVGHGFIQDDFAWILHARSSGVLDALDRAFTTSIGFYRPLVTLSFALNEWLFDLQPFGYGLTNLALALAGIVAVGQLGRRLGLTPPYSMLAAAIWGFNFHGINMGVLWLSGRSTLLSTLFALLAACAFESRRSLLAAAWTMLALLSKEDAVMLPFILVAWRLVDERSGESGGSEDPPPRLAGAARGAPFIGRGGSSPGSPARQPRWGGSDPPGVLRDCWPLFVPLVVYAALRSQSGAFTPSTAPDFYRFTVDAGLLVRNFVEYVQRSVSTGAMIAVGLLVATRMRPRLQQRHAIFTKTLLWWLGGFALTIWLPVRSNLYAVFPSIGVAIAVATLAQPLVSTLPIGRRRMLVGIGLLLPFLLLPVYRARNVRWVSLADVSTATLAHAQAMLPQVPDRAVIALIDDRDVRANFINTFSGLTPEASQLFLERGIELVIEQPYDPSRARVDLELADVTR